MSLGGCTNTNLAIRYRCYYCSFFSIIFTVGNVYVDYIGIRKHYSSRFVILLLQVLLIYYPDVASFTYLYFVTIHVYLVP